MFNWLFGKKLSDAVMPTKKVRICGVYFTIKKIDVLEHLKGTNAAIQSYGTYTKDKPVNPDDVSVKKVKQHYTDVFLASIISPEITRTKEEGRVCVEDLFNNWELCYRLYEQIMLFTYGKKKLKLFGYRG